MNEWKEEKKGSQPEALHFNGINIKEMLSGDLMLCNEKRQQFNSLLKTHKLSL